MFLIFNLYKLLLVYGEKDQFEKLDHPPLELHSLSLPAAMPPGMGEGGGVGKGPPKI